MIPSSPEQQQQQRAANNNNTKRVRFPSANLSHVAHVDVVSQEHRQEYWYTPAEYSVIEREIKQTVRRLRKRVAAEMKLESLLVMANDHDDHESNTTTTTTTTSQNKRQRRATTTTATATTATAACSTDGGSASASSNSRLFMLDTTKYCDRGLEDLVHHYETKQLKTTIAKVILAEQEIQRARGVHDPVALMQVSMACTQLSRQQAMALAQQDAKDVLGIVSHDAAAAAAAQQQLEQQQQPSDLMVVADDHHHSDSDSDDDACRVLFSHDMTNICDDITLTTSSATTGTTGTTRTSPTTMISKENHAPMRPITLLSICDQYGEPQPPPRSLIRSEVPMSG